MRKKIAAVLIAVLLAFVFAFTACGDGENGGEIVTPPKKVTDGDICTEIIVQKLPNKLKYRQGEKFNPAGLIFDAVYANGFDGDMGLDASDLDGYSPFGALTTDVTEITLKFEGVEYKIPITVLPKTLLGVEVVREPDVKSYSEGDTLDLSGLIVRSEYEEEINENEQAFVIEDAAGNRYEHGTVLDTASGVLELFVRVTSGDVTKSDSFFISVYAGLSVQAEDVLAEGDEIPTDRSYTKVSRPSEMVKHDCTFTGTGYIGGILKNDTLEFNIYSPVAVQGAELVLVVSSTLQGNGRMEDMQFNRCFKLTKGEEGTEIPISDDVIIEGKEYPAANSGGNKWTNWADASFGYIDLVAGYTKITLTCIGTINDISNYGRTPNVDRLDIRYTADDTQGDVITDLEITKAPDKTTYVAGEFFTPAGICFDVVYQNGYDGNTGLDETDLTGWSPKTALTADVTEITLYYKSFAKTIPVTVSEAAVRRVEITAAPDVKSYFVGDALDLRGLVVKATYSTGVTENETNYAITDAAGKTYTQGTVLDTANDALELTVTVVSGGASATSSFTVGVYRGVSVQAEDCVSDGSVPTSGSYTVLHTANGQGQIKRDCTFTGTGYIGSIARGFEIEFYIWSETAVEDAELVLIVSSTCLNNAEQKMDDMQFNRLFSVSVGEAETPVEIGDGVTITGKPFPAAGSSGNKWTNWDEVSFGTVDLAQGYTKVTLTCIGSVTDSGNDDRTPNLDRLDVRF